MVKVRLQGSRNEIRWFLKVLEKDPRFDVEDTSEMFSIKTLGFMQEEVYADAVSIEDTSLTQADVEKMQIKKKAKKSLKRKRKKKRR